MSVVSMGNSLHSLVLLGMSSVVYLLVSQVESHSRRLGLPLFQKIKLKNLKRQHHTTLASSSIMRFRNNTNGSHILAYKSCYLVSDGIFMSCWQRPAEVECAECSQTRLYTHLAYEVLWCRDCLLRTALPTSVLHFCSKQHNITS